MNSYSYESSSSEDANLVYIKNILEKNECRNYDMIQALESGNWKLNKQEVFYLNNNPDRAYEYLMFRYKFYRITTNNLNNVEAFPPYVVIEPASVCNLRCRMCFQQDENVRKQPYAGVMELDVFKRVVDELEKEGCGAVTFAGRGEPLLNPHFSEFLEYISGKILEIKINTNGLLLTQEMCHSILRSNVNMLVFSAEGTNEEEYAMSRCGGKLSRLIDNIKMFNEIKENEYPQNKTLTRVSGVLMGDVDKEKYYRFWEQYVDEVVLVEYEERSNTYENVANLKDTPCFKLWRQLYVWWDGICSPCDLDYLAKLCMGNVKENSIKDIWNSDKMKEIRNKHRERMRKECFPCDRCDE